MNMSAINFPILKKLLMCCVKRKNVQLLYICDGIFKVKSAQKGFSRGISIANLSHHRDKSSAAKPKFSSPTMNNEWSGNTSKALEAAGWLTVGQYSVYAWSVSGIESCVVVKSDDITVAFDMGIAVQESVKASTVFITHGHVDHIGAVASHVSKRALNGMKAARYFVPPHLVEPLKTVMLAHGQMAETMEALNNVNILPIGEGDIVKLNSSYFVKPFSTLHRIPSQGYILYKETKKLKEQLKGLPGYEIAAMNREGKDIHDIVVTPEVAYCGDTIFDVFLKPPTPDLLKVKLLITEATFLDEETGKDMAQKAKDRGHTHLSELIENPELFNEVEHIILVHFSNKYPSKYISDCFQHRLPPQLRNKVTPAVVAKTTFVST